MSIHRSFATGDVGEKRVITLLTKAGIAAAKNEDKTTREFFDIECELDGKKFTCEVKYDVMSEKTGNVAFEFFNSKSDKPSGIYGTKANLWFHLLPDGDNIVVCFCTVARIREYCRDVSPLKVLNKVGDNNADIMLYTVDKVMEELFQRVDNIENEQVLKLVKRAAKC